MRAIAAAVSTLALCATGCGYHVAGKSDLMPQTIHTIAITPFVNRTIRYKLAQRLPAESIAREFLEQYALQNRHRSEDGRYCAGWRGDEFSILPHHCRSSLRARHGECSAAASESHVDGALPPARLLFTAMVASFEARERYEISVDPASVFR